MGFFKRFLSLGSRKSRRKQESRTAQLDSAGRTARYQEPGLQDQEGDATRLLRSSSAHFHVVTEVDYSTLPPLPHPINTIAHAPSVTPPKSVSSMERRGTYTVKVLERKLESKTEFPNANPPLAKDLERNRRLSQDSNEDSSRRARADFRSVPFTPRDQSRIIRLRQDPSVASLLNMYDDNGCLSSKAFSNSPSTPTPAHGREQVKRSGSTLRQLLGDPDKSENAEGDISWAERFLGEHANTSQCSLASTAPVETPQDSPFIDAPSINAKPIIPSTNITFLSETSQEASVPCPLISSMEVEVSGTDHNTEVDDPSTTTLKGVDSKTPLRASEVFGFLSERRKTVLERQRSLRPSQAAIPLALVSLNSTTDKSARPSTASGSPDISETSIITSAQIHTATLTKVTPVLNPLSHSSDSSNVLNLPKTQTLSLSSQVPPPNTRMQFMGDSQHSQGSASTNSSKMPRGPRSLSTTLSGSSLTSKNLLKASLAPDIYRDTYKEKNVGDTAYPQTGSSNASSTRIPVPVTDPFTPIKQCQQRRIASHTSSVASNDGDSRRTGNSHHHKRSRKAERVHVQVDKENTPPSVATAIVPLRTVFDKRYPKMVNGDPPSPASSTDLSPMTKEMMASLRKQRMRMREGVRSSVGRSSRRHL